MRILPVLLAVAAAGLSSAPPAHGQVRSTIVGPGVTRYPIAVAPLKQIAGGAGERFTAVLTRDLELSGLSGFCRATPTSTTRRRPVSQQRPSISSPGR